MVKIKDIMNENVITISPTSKFDDIIKIMQEHSIGKLPVVDEGKCIGVITRDDILIKEERVPVPHVIAFWDVLITLPSNKTYAEKFKKFSAYLAKDIMTDKFYKVTQDATVEKVVTDILEKKYNFAIVFNGNDIVGIVTKSDLIKNFNLNL